VILLTDAVKQCQISRLALAIGIASNLTTLLATMAYLLVGFCWEQRLVQSRFKLNAYTFDQQLSAEVTDRNGTAISRNLLTYMQLNSRYVRRIALSIEPHWKLVVLQPLQ